MKSSQYLLCWKLGTGLFLAINLGSALFLTIDSWYDFHKFGMTGAFWYDIGWGAFNWIMVYYMYKQYQEVKAAEANLQDDK